MRPVDANGSRLHALSGNQIPASRFSAVAAGLLQRVPLPTASGAVQNLLAVERENTPMDQGAVRVDHRLSDNDTMFSRFTAYNVRDVQPFGTSSLNETLIPGSAAR